MLQNWLRYNYVDYIYPYVVDLLLNLLVFVARGRDRVLARKLYLLADVYNPKENREILGGTKFSDYTKEKLPKYLRKYSQDFTWVKMNFVRRMILAERILRVSLEPDIGDVWKYTKIALIKKVRILFGVGLRDAKIIVEEVFPEMVCGHMKPQEDTWWQRFSYWRHKRIWI